METCRLCVTKARTKYELKDVKQFLSEIPFLKDLIGDVYSQNVCYTCYNSSKAAEKFLERIRKAQEKFPSVSKPIQPSNEEILRKYQGISFKKVKLPAVVEDDFDAPYLKQEHSEPTIVVDYANFEIKHEEEYLIDDGAEDYVDNDDDCSEDDNDTTDESYTPSTSKAKQSSKSKVTKQNTESTEKKQKNVGGIYLDAPTCYTCSKCKVEYATYEELYKHMKSLECDQTSLTCELCNKTFATKKALHSHAYSHRSKETFLCEDCGKSFNNQFSLDIHIQTHRRIELDAYIFRCCHCDKKFNNHLDLSDHVKQHAKDRKEAPRLCETCGKNCANLKAYQAHVVTHSEKLKKYICDICKKAFRRKIFLVQHSHVHTGIKAFQCNMCEKSFAKSESLVYHVRNHQNIKPYSCEKCSESFVSLAKLKTHTSRSHN